MCKNITSESVVLENTPTSHSADCEVSFPCPAVTLSNKLLTLCDPSMVAELRESTESSQKLAALGLRTDWEGKRGELHGLRLEQGQMMHHIAEWFTAFEA